MNIINYKGKDMALFTMEKTASTEIEVEELSAKNPSFDSITPMEDIIKQIAGYKWETDYYNLVSDLSSFQSTLDFGVDDAITEYNLIKDMVIIVDSVIDNSEPSQISGSGTVDGDFIPKNGDFFLAKLIDGGVGIFTLTSVKKETYNLNHIFKIEYKLYYILREKDDVYYSKINNKTINTFYYNREYLSTSDKKMFTSEEKTELEKISRMFKSLLKIFNNKVLKDLTKYTITMEIENDMVYDPYLEDFILSTIGENNLISKVTTFNVSTDNIFTILNIIKDKTDVSLVDMYREYLSDDEFNFNPFLRTLSWSGITKCISIVNSTIVENYEIIDNSNLSYNIVDDDYYIFSRNFYLNLLGDADAKAEYLTILEKIVIQYINKSVINFEDIDKIYKDIVKENAVPELLYYVPILLFILKDRITVTNIEHF